MNSEPAEEGFCSPPVYSAPDKENDVFPEVRSVHPTLLPLALCRLYILRCYPLCTLLTIKYTSQTTFFVYTYTQMIHSIKLYHIYVKSDMIFQPIHNFPSPKSRKNLMYFLQKTINFWRKILFFYLLFLIYMIFSRKFTFNLQRRRYKAG